MRLDRLFNVLVLQGALLVGACDEEGEPPGPSDDGAASTGETGAQPVEGSSDGGPSATTTSDPTAPADTEGSTAEGSGGATSGDAATDDGPSEGSTGEPLECSEPANGTDPCGCPCCWVQECTNTDACCTGWSECAPS